ncbi:hypothetical protein MTO96_007303 [Rhipicephalus appendiculatus]
MAAPVKPDSTQRRKSSQDQRQTIGYIAPGSEPPTHGTRLLVEQPVQPPQAVPRKDSDQPRRLSAHRASDGHAHPLDTGAHRASVDSQHSLGVSRRESGESNPRGVRRKSSYGQHPQPQRSRSLPTLPEPSGRVGYIESHMRYSGAAFSGMEIGRGIYLPPAVMAAAAAMQTPLSSRRSSQGSVRSTMVQRPSVAIFYTVVAVLGLIGFMAILFSFLSSLLDHDDTSKPATCTTHACREYASRLVDSINWTCTALLTKSHCELEAVKSALRTAGVMWPHRPPPAGRRDLLRMMFHCDYALGWSAVFRVDPRLYQNSTKAYVLTDSGFSFIVRKYHERSTEAHREHYFNRLRDAFRDGDADGAADVVTLKEMQQLEDKMFGPLLADLYKSAPKVSTVPDGVVYSSSANLSDETVDGGDAKRRRRAERESGVPHVEPALLQHLR